MPEEPAELKAEKNAERREVCLAILLGFATLGTGFSVFQSSLAGGESQDAYARSQMVLNAALSSTLQVMDVASAEATALMMADSYRKLAEAGVSPKAYQAAADKLEEKYVDPRIAKESRSAKDFDEVEADAYLEELLADANEMIEQGEKALREARDQGAKGDNFEATSLGFTLAMFFGGIAPVFRRPKVQTTLLFAGSAVFLGALVQLIRLMI